MKFTEAEAAWLRAALDGKTVEYRKKTNSYGWTTATAFFEDVIHLSHPDYEVRIKPDVIIVNGIEVPAAITSMPPAGSDVYYPDFSPDNEQFVDRGVVGYYDSHLSQLLTAGLLYLDRAACEQRSKAMRAHKPG